MVLKVDVGYAVLPIDQIKRLKKGDTAVSPDFNFLNGINFPLFIELFNFASDIG